jgi:hypothetical protein
MPDLSPAAQAVLKAACIHHGLFNEEIVQRRRMAAAALRAAADHIDHDWSGFNCVDALCEIAAELEAQ